MTDPTMALLEYLRKPVSVFFSRMGATWVMTTRRPVWLTVPVATMASGLTLALADFIGDAFGSPTPGALGGRGQSGHAALCDSGSAGSAGAK